MNRMLQALLQLPQALVSLPVRALLALFDNVVRQWRG